MPDPEPQIIAIGGGGFSMEPENPALDLYVLAQTGVERPRVCFIPTASGDSERYTLGFYQAFSRYDCRPTNLPFFDRTPDLRALLLEQDLIYVGGGNTKSMLAVWRDWELVEILREAWQAGIVLAGVSAGAICWFEQGLTDSLGAGLTRLDCLGFLRGSCSPHYDAEAERRPVFQDLIGRGTMAPGYALDDCAGLHFTGRQLLRAVASRPGAQAYRVEVQDGIVTESPLPIEPLQAPEGQG